VSHRSTRIIPRLAIVLILISLAVVVSSLRHTEAHQDPCHRLHSCPSDHSTYVCGDKGRCDQCPDNEYCLARQPRVTSSVNPAPAPRSPSLSATTTPSAVSVCFTPGGNCTDTIVKALSDAKRTVLVQAYSFTSASLAKALLDAHKRGVQVQVILDKSQRNEKYSSADFLANQGVPTMIDANHAIAHNKVIVIDGEVVITGSFNFTKAAQEKNAENLLIIRDPALAAQYAQNWDAHRQHSQSYVGRGVR
jgi:phosphatidylserine/phosphatidylglycerophosphate/cardiolipin synthase-like enzyme